MKKLLYMTLHFPCVLLLALHDSLWIYKDNILFLRRRLVREVKTFFLQAFKFIFYLMVATPIIMAFMIFMIKLS